MTATAPPGIIRYWAGGTSTNMCTNFWDQRCYLEIFHDTTMCLGQAIMPSCPSNSTQAPRVEDAPVLMLRPRAWNMTEHNVLLGSSSLLVLMFLSTSVFLSSC